MSRPSLRTTAPLPSLPLGVKDLLKDMRVFIDGWLLTFWMWEDFGREIAGGRIAEGKRIAEGELLKGNY
jgi:hypothetical protein